MTKSYHSSVMWFISFYNQPFLISKQYQRKENRLITEAN